MKQTTVVFSLALSFLAACQGGSNTADNRPGTSNAGIGGSAGTSSGASGLAGASGAGAGSGGLAGAGAPPMAGRNDPGEGGDGGDVTAGQGGSIAGTSGAGTGGSTAEGGEGGAPTCSECLDTQCASERAACEDDSECGPCLSCLETSMSLAECPFPDPCNLALEGPTFDLLECGLDQCVQPCGI